MGETIRKTVRSDKKIDCKPTIPVSLKESIYRISYITNTPVKDVAEKTCNYGINSSKIIDTLSESFRRNYEYKNTIYIGDLSSKTSYSNNEVTERITIRFKQRDFENIRRLSYAMDVTPSRCCSILLERTIIETNFINKYIKAYLREHLDDARLKELKRVITFINKNSPQDKKVSWAHIFSYLVDELKMNVNSISKDIQKWLKSLN